MCYNLKVLKYFNKENPPLSPPYNTSLVSEIISALCPIDNIISLDFLNPRILPPPLKYLLSS